MPDEMQQGRRNFLRTASFASFALYALLREAHATEAIPRRGLSARYWIDRQDELAHALRAGTVAHMAWHDEVNRLAREVDVAELMAEAMRAHATRNVPFMRDPVKRSLRFLDAQGEPRHLAYAAALFEFGPSSVITPHAHRHMASAHMVVEGKVRIRTFDRIGEEEGALLIRPTGDHVGGIGDAAAMTTEKDNIHWFTPASSRATTFDVIVDGLDPGQDAYLIEPIDPLGGKLQPDGSIVAPRLSFEESMRRYTAQR